MTDAKPTPGPWVWNPECNAIVAPADASVSSDDDSYYGGKLICESVWSEPDARLLAEAGTVHHETGLTPRQLAEQRAELLEALDALLGPDRELGGRDTPRIQNARAAIARARARGER